MVIALSSLVAKFFGEVTLSENTINLLSSLPTKDRDGYLVLGRSSVKFYETNRAEIVEILEYCGEITDIRLIDFLVKEGFDYKVIFDTLSGDKINPSLATTLVWALLDLMSGVIYDGLLINS